MLELVQMVRILFSIAVPWWLLLPMRVFVLAAGQGICNVRSGQKPGKLIETMHGGLHSFSLRNGWQKGLFPAGVWAKKPFYPGTLAFAGGSPKENPE
jgi:hypothetical protein